MNFLQLEYFLTILKFNSISKAASELYITQPALSQQLIHLEKELDTKLFYRKGNSLILTEAGERFRDSAQNMLYEYRTMQTMMAELKDNGSFSGNRTLIPRGHKNQVVYYIDLPVRWIQTEVSEH